MFIGIILTIILVIAAPQHRNALSIHARKLRQTAIVVHTCNAVKTNTFCRTRRLSMLVVVRNRSILLLLM